MVEAGVFDSTYVADLALWQDDIDFLIDQLIDFNGGEGPFRGRLDTQQIGIMGYSKGGALAGQVCATSDRVRAGVNLGGFVFGGLVDNEFDFHTAVQSLENSCLV